MNRRVFIKFAGALAGMGLIQPIELIKLFKPKSETFYSLPQPTTAKILSSSELNELLKKTYGKQIAELFEKQSFTYNMLFQPLNLADGGGYQYAIKPPQIL
jgi:hypothetical protein